LDQTLEADPNYLPALIAKGDLFVRHDLRCVARPELSAKDRTLIGVMLEAADPVDRVPQRV
jgi:hypothetical protein